MKLIIGGAYQGKLDYAKDHFDVREVFFCSQERAELDFSKEAICGLEQFTLACVKSGLEAKDYLREHRQLLEDKVLICTDISQGIVPIDMQQRAMREMTGRALVYLAQEAETVIRVFCGLGCRLK